MSDHSELTDYFHNRGALWLSQGQASRRNATFEQREVCAYIADLFHGLARLSERQDRQDDYIKGLHDQLDNYQSYYEKVGEVYKATMAQVETLQQMVENRTALDQVDAGLDKLASEAGT